MMKASSRRLRRGLLLMSVTVLAAAGPWTESLPEAASRGDHEAVRSLLAAGADVNAAAGDGMTALHWAAELGDVALARVLMNADADPNLTTRLGAYTPLHVAAKAGRDDVLTFLLEEGADPDAATSTGAARAIHFAAAADRVVALRSLIAHGASVDVREIAWGQTPLMFAAASARIEAATVLLDAGADPTLSATVLDMPTRDAADRADEQRRRLMMSGRDPATLPGAGSGLGDVNEAQRDRGVQALSHAELVGGYGGLTALLLAVREGHADMAELLLDRGAGIEERSGDGTTPLLMAAINGHFDLALSLMNRGADVDAVTDAGAGALYLTINTEWIPKSRHPQPTHRLQQEVSYIELMTGLLERGADPNVRLEKQLWFTTFGDDYLRVDRMGATPFWRAAYALDIAAMKLLVAHGADPEIPTRKTPERFRRAEAAAADPSGLPPVEVGGPGVYAIHAASGVGYGEGFAANIHRHVPGAWVPAVRYLVEELGADVNARDHNGYSAVHHAASRGDNALILYLLEKGADPAVVSRRGQTTVDMANGPVQRISPFPGTIALLEGLGAQNNHNCVGC